MRRYLALGIRAQITGAALLFVAFATACAPAAAPAPTAAPTAPKAAESKPAAAAPAAPAAPAAAPAAAAKPDAGALRLGMVAPQSGGASPYGLSLIDGYKMALEEINAAGGMGGRKVDLVAYDSQSTPATAATLTQKLVFEEKVPLVIGSASSLDTLAMMEITENNKVPLFVPSAASPKITGQNYKWVWRQSLTDGETAKLMAAHISKTLQWKKVAALYENSDYGKPPVQIATDELKKLGVEIGPQEAFNVGDPDISAQLLRLRDSRPDGVILWAKYQEGALALRQNQQLGARLQLIGNQGLVYPAFLELLDANLKDSGLLNITQFVWTDDNPKQIAWVKRFKDKYGREPDVTAMDAYDGAFVTKLVIEAAGGLEAAKLQAAFNQVKYEGVGGPIAFDSTGQAVRGAVVTQLKDGTFKVIGRASL